MTTRQGFALAPMSIRVSPYLLSLIDWANAYTDPLRRQFVRSRRACCPTTPTHARLAPRAGRCAGAGPQHRYPTRRCSRARHVPRLLPVLHPQLRVGVNTEEVEKVSLKATEERWEQAFRYISERPELRGHLVCRR